MTITKLEKLSNRAQPAPDVEHYDGWRLRFAAGYTRRANSVHTLDGSSLPLSEKIAYCEKRYTDAGQRVIFKMTDAVIPSNLDSVLAERGYQREGETGVFLLDIRDKAFAPADNAHCSETLQETWLADYCRLNAVPADHQQTLQKMLTCIEPECCFLSLYDRQENCIGVALGVIEDDTAGIFDVVVDSQQRKQGYGRQLMQHLLAWSKNQGAEQVYLQVTATNTPARALYQQIGFEDIYQYWYRTKDLRP
ncbi:MAG: GNAT family N-acetyltransferase [Aggregatilineales bacterium]